MSLQEEIKKINERIEALNKDMQSLMSELDAGVENDFPQDGDTYSYINTYGGVESDIWEGHFTERNMVKIGNFFKTEEEAEFQVEKLKVEAELRKFSRPFKYGDWNFEILWNNHENNIELDWSGYVVRQSVIYFESGEVAEKAIEAVGKERIKKYIFGVEG